MSLEDVISATVERTVSTVIGKLAARLDAAERLQAAPVKLLYPEREAAELLGIASATLKKWRCSGRVKAHTPAGSRLPLYSPENLKRICVQLSDGSLLA